MAEKISTAFLWQYEYANRWITYSDEKLEAINKAYNKGQKTVTIPDNDLKKRVLVNFDKMFHKKLASGWEHRIRCCVFDKNFYVWQWKDDNDFWFCYVPGVSLELESCFKLKKKAKFYWKNDYEVDFNTFTQTNVVTGNVRHIQREKVSDVKRTAAVQNIELVFLSSLNTKREDLSSNADGTSENGFLQAKIKSPKLNKENGAPQAKIKSPKLNEETGASVVKYLVKGKAPVDPQCTQLVGKAHVYTEGLDVFDVMLNLTDLRFNNNKYYRMQVLKGDSNNKFYVWFRWGRIGNAGQNNLIPCSDVSSAKKIFMEKFSQKTRNSWEQRNLFEQHAGKYDLVKLDYGTEKIKEETEVIPKSSKLDPEVADLLKLISDVEEMAKCVVEMKYDVKKAPLGKLTQDQILAGYAALVKIDRIVKRNGLAAALVEANNEFYTRIPHNFGMKPPTIINTKEAVKEKMELLESLRHIEVAVELQNDSEFGSRSFIDFLYDSLKCELKVLDPKDKMFPVIEKYLMNSHGPTHNTYTMKIKNIYEVHKEDEDKKFVDYGNSFLLWHGSRLTNFVGILKQGLLIAPPEAPSTGYMFGKGLYFADISSKSANYCYPTKHRNEGLLLLCEVSLGDQYSCFYADENAKEAAELEEKHSIMAIGKYKLDIAKVIEQSGVKIPLGKPQLINSASICELCYNEYIVYNTSQVKIKYLLHIQFLFKP